MGYEEHVYSIDREQSENGVNGESKPEEVKVENPGERMAQFLLESKILGPYTPLEKISNLFQFFENPQQRKEFFHLNRGVDEAIRKYNPDLVYVDASLVPVVYYSKIPWVKNISTTPLFFG